MPTKIENWISGDTQTFVPYRAQRSADLPVLINVLFRQNDGRLRRLDLTMPSAPGASYGPTNLNVFDVDG